MNCDCIERINAKLKEAGHSHELAPSLVFDDKMRLDVLLSVRTRWIGEPAPRKEEQAAARDDLHILPVLSQESWREQEMNTECNADLGHPCDSDNGEPCGSCAAEIAYWRDQWIRYGQYEMRDRRTREQYEADVRDAYSDPTEYAKRERLLNL